MNVLPYLSRDLKTMIANEAVDDIKYYIIAEFKGTGASTAGVYPIVEDGSIGIGILDEYEYLVYQDRGFETFQMHALEGKVVPLPDGEGGVKFRRVKNVGFPTAKKGRYVRRDPSGELYVSEEPRTRWTHPGLMPRHFIEDAVKRGVNYHRLDIAEELAAFGIGLAPSA